MPTRYLPSLLAAVLFCVNVHGQEIVAHRGASHDAPENTLPAFALAWNQGADAIEGDFYLTKDQQIVCVHDKTTKRVAPNQPVLHIAKSTYRDLQQLDVGSWKHPRFTGARIPTLRQVLATVPDGKKIFVEIKCGREIIAPLRKELAASKLKPEQVVIICFHASVIAECRRVMARYKANWLTGYKQKTGTSDWEPTAERVVKTLREIQATGLGSNGKREVIDRRFVDAVRAAGMEFHVWTVNDIDSARRFQTLGVDSITTDLPRYVRSILRASQKNERTSVAAPAK